MYNNSHVKLDIPVQYEYHNSFMSRTDWFDCVVTKDGLHIDTGGEQMNRRYSINEFKLRNTPLVYVRQIDLWYKQELEKLNAEYHALKKLGEARLKEVKFQYKSKTQIKKEILKAKPTVKKDYQIK